MIIFKTAKDISASISEHKKEGGKIGFVPTMGALHDGHLSLINEVKTAGELCVCSIFVNPTQFNDSNDFKHYPITIEKDIERLIVAGCNFLFMPDQSEIYPPGYNAKVYDLGRLDEVLEGRFRPRHFQGVCQVVDRLLQIVNTDTLYLGQKDYQQCMVIARLLELTNRTEDIKLNIASTIREKSGLAMSSRNSRLTEQERIKAAAISENLFYIKQHLNQLPFEQLKESVQQNLTNKGFKIDYIEIAHADSLAPAINLTQPLVALIAASLGGVRLIDNMLLN